MDSVQSNEKICCLTISKMIDFESKVDRGNQSYTGELIMTKFDPRDRNNLTIKEEIEVLKAINENDQLLRDEEIETLSLPEYYLE